MVKTTELTGTEVKVEGLGGQNVAVKNLGSGSIYVSTKPNITAGADNVIEIPAGAGEVVLDAHGTVYIVGTGKVQCTGTSYAVPNFKLPSTSSGGGGGTSDVTKEYVDAQDTTNLNLAKAYTDNAKSEIQTTIDTVNDTLNTHIADQVKHITAEEREKWNAKAETDTATTTADGLMSAADKEKLDGIAANANKYSLPLATASVRGGAKIGYEENGKNYPVELDSEKMFVNVPWENTTYSEATTSAAGLMSAADKSSLNTHIADQVKHITAEERAAWNAKAELTDIPTSLPANGGNADTVDGLHANEIASNPNLLINPDFKINQRNVSRSITTTGYFVDRWQLVSGTVTINSDGTILLDGTIKQILENYAGEDVSVSASAGTASYDNSTKTFSITANNRTISWAKLELGTNATPFIPPDPATELAKCQRYFYRTPTSIGSVGVGFIGGIDYASGIINFPVPMRANPTMTLNGTFSLATAKYNGSSGVIKVTEFNSGCVTTKNYAQVVFKHSTNDSSIVGNAFLLEQRDDGYIDFDAEL